MVNIDGGIDLMENWLSSLSAVGGMAKKTIEAYRHDVSHFIHFISNHYGKRSSKAVLSKVNVKDMRSWISHARSSGLSPRSLARALSAIKSFYRWLGQTYGNSTTAVLSTRTPKFEKPLPRPVKKSDAKNLINQIDIQSEKEWINARNVAVITLLYGCGLRISEALSLTFDQTPLPDILNIIGKGNKERIIPVLPIAQAAVKKYLKECPYSFLPGGVPGSERPITPIGFSSNHSSICSYIDKISSEVASRFDVFISDLPVQYFAFLRLIIISSSATQYFIAPACL